MKQEIERQLRATNPETVTGLDEKKVKGIIGTLTDRIGKKGKTALRHEIVVPDVFISIQELHLLAHKLKDHSLRILACEAGPLWHPFHA